MFRPQRDWRLGVTNEQVEFAGAGGEEDPEELEYIDVSQLQIPNPEEGPLEQRIATTYEEGLFSDEISLEDSKYWFTEPKGGWNVEPMRIPKAKVLDNTIPDARAPGPDRAPMSSLSEGQELQGTVDTLFYYHGALIDLGTDFHGLVPIENTEWSENLRSELEIDAAVTVRIHKIRDPKLYRWPIQLELLSAAAQTLPPPEVHRPALDLRDRGNLKELVAETGREYKTVQYYADQPQIDFEYNEEWKDDDLTVAELWAPELHARVSDLAAGL